jgi:Tfp pilus assembly protein PilF
MEYGPVNRRSGRWRLSSPLLFILLLGLASAGQAAAKGSLLVFPLKSHWLSQPLAEAATAAVSDRLSHAGYTATQVFPKSPVVQLAASEEWIPAAALEQDDLTTYREPLGVATGADAALFGDIAERETEVVLHLTLSGTVSGQETTLELSAPREADQSATAAALAEKVVAALTPAVWAQIRADVQGKRAAAAQRYAAGQAAMAASMYGDALLNFEAALLGDPTNRTYLTSDAAARGALGDYSGAVVRMRSLAAVAPSDAEISVQLGNAALRAGRPAEAEAAFLGAAEDLGQDPRVVEGLALACKAQGKRERAQEYYQVLVGLLPALANSPPTLPGLLANSDVTVQLSDVPPEEIGRELGRFYLAQGYLAQGVAWLLSYHRQGGRPPYDDAEYLDIAASLDEESSGIAADAQGLLAGREFGQSDDEQASARMQALHDRSDALATLAERMQVSPLLDPAHRYRVLAFNLLNQSNFEALMYLQTNDSDRQKRSDLLRDAFQKSRDEARALAAGLMGAEAAPLPQASPGSGHPAYVPGASE